MDDMATSDLAGTADPIALWVAPVGDFGGVARHILDAATAGVPGWRVVVLAPPGPLIDACRLAGVPAIAAALGPEHGLRRSVRTLRRTANRIRPALIHTHLAHADITAAFAFPGRRGPTLISTEHGISGDPALYQRSRMQSVVMAKAHRFRLRAFDGVIAVSKSTREQIRERWNPPQRLPIEVIVNGVDRVPDAGNERSSGLRIATLSRISHEKRLESTLQAFVEIHRREPEARLTIAGEGPDRALLIQACTDLGIAEAVSFPGFVDSRELLGRTDVIVQLSAWENCSYTLIDALAAGVGVVATPVGGNSEVVSSTALVPADRPRLIADAVLGQAKNPDSRPSLPLGWPSCKEMTASVSQFYGRVSV